MDTAVADLLYLIAEVSIATVALSGITMVLLVGDKDVTRRKSAMITIQLRMSSVVAIAAVLPLVLALYEIEVRLTWQVATAVYFTLITVTAVTLALVQRLTGTMPGILRLITLVPATTAFCLLPYNIWLGSAWPYITQLFIAWAVSLVLFLSFIQLILDERTE